jgi:hypothetical protein
MRQPTIADAVAPDSMISKFDPPAVDVPGMVNCLAYQVVRDGRLLCERDLLVYLESQAPQ